MRNCPNCAAPIDPAKPRCDYCGTHFVDLSRVNLSDPVMLRLGGLECLTYAADIRIEDLYSPGVPTRNAKGEIISGTGTTTRAITVRFMEVPAP